MRVASEELRPLPGQGGGIEQRQRLGLRGGRGDAADQVRGLVVVAADYHHVLGAAKHPRQVRVTEVRENRDAPARQPGLVGGAEVTDHHDLHPCLAVGVVAGQRRRLRTVADHDDVVPAPFGVEEFLSLRKNCQEDLHHRDERDSHRNPARNVQGNGVGLLRHLQDEQLDRAVERLLQPDVRFRHQPAPGAETQHHGDHHYPEQVPPARAPALVTFHGHTNLQESTSRFHDGQLASGRLSRVGVVEVG